VQEFPSRPLIYGPGEEQVERTSGKIEKLAVMEGSGCSHCVRSCLEGELGQTWGVEGVMWMRRRWLGIAQRAVEGACFLKNWSLYHEAGERDELRRRRERRKYQ